VLKNQTMIRKNRKTIYLGLIVLVLALALYVFSGTLLTSIGGFLVANDPPMQSDAVVVLNTGLEYYSRLIQAADLYKEGFVKKVVVNGNRKNDVLRKLERKGFQVCCPWYEESTRILGLLGVPREQIITISAENAYDTVSEAKAVGESLIQSGISRIITNPIRAAHATFGKAYFKTSYRFGSQLLVVILIHQVDGGRRGGRSGGFWRNTGRGYIVSGR
jgi:hypothetical protein